MVSFNLVDIWCPCSLSSYKRYKDNSSQNLLDVHDINNSSAFLAESLGGKAYENELLDCSDDNSMSQNEFDSDSRSHSPNIDTDLNPIDD